MSRRKEIINITAEINKIDSKKQYRNSMKPRAGSSDKTNQICQEKKTEESYK